MTRKAPALDTAPAVVPASTYRFQFHAGFTFRDAIALVPYLADLGVTHVYASPFLKAREGSTHGYDIVDHGALNPEIGTEEDFTALTDVLKQHGMGMIADFVSNHMGVAQADNPWWLDVLEYGEGSPYAEFFDIDFHPMKTELRGKVLLPFLGDHYGRVLEDGHLVLKLDAAQGNFSVWYWEHRFPITPYRYGGIFTVVLPALRKAGLADAALAEMEEIVAGFREVRRTVRSSRAQGQRRQKAERLKEQFAALLAEQPALADAISEALAAFQGKPGDPPSFLPLHRLLEAQHYRLAYWRTASDEINYRRFFQINDLAGLRVEVPAVFDASHKLILQLLGDGRIDGIRIDHIDGLFDPKGYLERLQEKARAATGLDRDTYVLVEKILGHHENLRTEWRCSGTTGYEALNEIGGLFVDGGAEERMTRTYARFTGESTDFEDIVQTSKHQVMRQELASELQVLVNGLSRLSERDWRTRDYTPRDLRSALEEVVACFPVYRTYIDRRRPAQHDLRDIEWAIAQARKNPMFPDESIFDYLWSILTTDAGRRKGDPFPRTEVLRLARKAQQVTSPVMAKGLEDTAFYRFNRLVSLNEVGGHPDVFGVTPGSFHHRMADRAKTWPHTMLSSATHDTKRGEDVRARINALSELSEAWTKRVRRWEHLNRRRKSEIDGEMAPAPNDEYLFYQVLVGVWTPGLVIPEDGVTEGSAEAKELDDLRERLEGYMLKALREAKVRSAWTRQNGPYEEAVLRWMRHILDGRRRNPFLADFQAFHARIARIGVVNGLAQAALKLTCPGVPDTYQGCELWEFSLVDPDNRRPVDFEARARLLDEMKSTLDAPGPFGAVARGLLDTWADSRVKLLLTWRLLQLRRRMPEFFASADYTAIEPAGRRAEHLLAFERRHGDTRMVVVVPRLVNPLMQGDEGWPLAEEWAATTLPVAGRFRDAITGEALEGTEGLDVDTVLKDFPLAVLVSE
ncbi:malto-oligosyltrehalose synthase [Caenispirillum salinarum]|uniref:malto-oligosyltrehalose synthase n=1 Tax=Caenispirillum salinarum TaxID=859058 RepID=UPI00384FF557